MVYEKLLITSNGTFARACLGYLQSETRKYLHSIQCEIGFQFPIPMPINRCPRTQPIRKYCQTENFITLIYIVDMHMTKIKHLNTLHIR